MEKLVAILEKVCDRNGHQFRHLPIGPENDFNILISVPGKLLASFVVPYKLGIYSRYEEGFQRDLQTLFYHEVFPTQFQLKEKQDVYDFVSMNFPDRSPNAKIERVLLFINSFSKYDGATINLNMELIQSNRPAFMETWLASPGEFDYYFSFLVENDLVGHPYKQAGLESGHHRIDSDIWVTVKGLERIIKVTEKQMSKICFVAMSFSPELRHIYDEAIAPAIRETGFEPLKIDDDASISSEQTINDAILAAIKKAKFTIADFTQHKAGVYFEAGYALGRGHKVIYTCREGEIDNAHFDTRNYPHIVWKDAADLKQQLINKIEVSIKA